MTATSVDLYLTRSPCLLFNGARYAIDHRFPPPLCSSSSFGDFHPRLYIFFHPSGVLVHKLYFSRVLVCTTRNGRFSLCEKRDEKVTDEFLASQFCHNFGTDGGKPFSMTLAPFWTRQKKDPSSQTFGSAKRNEKLSKGIL